MTSVCLSLLVLLPQCHHWQLCMFMHQLLLWLAVASTSVGLPGVPGQKVEFPAPSLTPVNTTMGVAGFSVAAFSISRLPVVTQAYSNFPMGSPQVSFLFQIGTPHRYFLLVLWCLLSVGKPFLFAPLQPLENTHGRYMCFMILVCGPYRHILSSDACLFFVKRVAILMLQCATWMTSS